ncbi:MAG: hypothetical protein E7392_03965 [Ruminococcaceae bacterium]|nr:hypothetical protein [Oscillospiraceae bacterium]
MFTNLEDLTGRSPNEALEIIGDYLRANKETLEYILTHLDSSNIIEIDLTKTKIYKGEDNEL